MKSRKTAKAVVTNHLCKRFPQSIATRLHADADIAECLKPVYDKVVSFGQIGSVVRGDLLNAAKVVIAVGGEQQVRGINGEEISITIQDGHLWIRRDAGEPNKRKVHFDELLLQSPDAAIRSKIFGTVSERIGPTFAALQEIQQAMNNGPLIDDQLDLVLTELAHGVAAQQARIAASFRSGGFQAPDILPSEWNYYYRFCGPAPEPRPFMDYVNSTLVPYRRELLERNFVQGLSICLLGALHDFLLPGQWITDRSDDVIWQTLDVINPWRDPFSLFAALDIAASRQEDVRFRNFAEKAVRALVQEEFPRSGGADGYSIMGSFAELMSGHMVSMENGPMKPPFWRRLCVWMQAGLLLQLSESFPFEFGMLKDWVDGHRTLQSALATCLDTTREPMVYAGRTDKMVIRTEILGRLLALKARIEQQGKQFPLGEEVEKSAGQFGLLAYASPGPLEGSLRPADAQNRVLPDESVEVLARELATDDFRAWMNAGLLSQCVVFNDTVMKVICEEVTKLVVGDGWLDDKRVQAVLHGACQIAAAHRNCDIADAVARTLIKRSPEARLNGEVGMIVTVIVEASSAYGSEAAWLNWLRERLKEVAYLLPAGSPVTEFLNLVPTLKVLTPWHLRTFSEVEAIARSA
ncbi:MAG: hypothetical protein OEV08_07850 [Nitrospira sp.]|nr:hypothetical protein [Nitrospira sp.]